MIEPFEYQAPRSLAEVHDLLDSNGDEAKVLAGGQSLMILLRQRLVTPRILVSLRNVASLKTLDLNEGVRLGSMVPYRILAGERQLAQRFPLLAQAAGSVGSAHIRNLGTVGGSLCHADPAGDVPTALLALDATLGVTSNEGSTSYPVSEFFAGLFQTKVRAGEILASIDVPPPPARATYAYRRFSYREGEYPMVTAACVLGWNGQGCTYARVAVGGGDLYPKRLMDVEGRLVGTPVGEEDRKEAVALAASSLTPIADVRGSSDWKSRVALAIVGRAIEQAAEKDRLTNG